MAIVAPGPFDTNMETLQFNTTFELLLQQKLSHFRMCVDSRTYVGRAAQVINQIAALQYKMPAARYAPLNFQIAQYTRPWVEPTDRSLTVPFDTFDALKSVADPKSAISQSVVAAANRFYDDIIIGAFFGSTQKGQDPQTWSAESFPTTASTTTSATAPFGGFLVVDTFGTGATVGFTFNKVREGRRVLQHYENDMDAEIYMGLGSQQESDALGQVSVIDKDYAAGAEGMESGRLRRMLGVTMIPSERLNTSSSNTLRNNPMWVRSGMHLGLWKEMSTRIDNRQDLESQPWQLYSMISAGAARTQLGKVVQINNSDSTGVDITP